MVIKIGARIREMSRKIDDAIKGYNPVKIMMKSILRLSILVTLLSSHLIADDDQFKAGQEAFQRGDYQAAINALKDAVKRNKKNLQGYILLGRTYLMADSTDLAIATLVQARELDTSNVTVFMLIGDAYSKQKIWAAAVEQYKKVTDLDGNITTIEHDAAGNPTGIVGPFGQRTLLSVDAAG